MRALVMILGATLSAAPAAAGWWGDLDPTLVDLIEQAQENNGDIRAARAQVTVSEASRDAQSAGILPSVSFDVGANFSPTDALGFQFGGIPSAPGAPEKPDVTTTASAMLNARLSTDLGRSIAGRFAGDQDVRAAEASVDQAREGLAIQVAQAWYDLASIREQLTLLERQRSSTAELVQAVELRFEKGDATALDLLNQRGQLASFEARIPSARAQETSARARLIALVGDAVEPPALAAARLPEDKLTVDGEATFNKRPDVRAAQARLDAAARRRWSAWLGLLPTLSFSANAGNQYFIQDETREQFIWGAGVSLSIPLFQGFGRASQVRQSSAAETATKAQLTQLMRARKQRLEEARSLETALLEQVEKTRTQVETAKMSFEESRSRYLQGLVDSTQLLLAQSSYFAAERGLLIARRTHADARLLLLEASGKDD